jgi:hypothetical protein
MRVMLRIREKESVEGAHGLDVRLPFMKIERVRADCNGWRPGIGGG